MVSSPVVGGVVYLGSDDWNVYCLKATTGSFVWRYTIRFSVESSAALVNGVVFVGSGDGKIYAFGPSPTALEFPLYLILPLFMMATLLAALVLERKRNGRTQ